MIRHSSKPRSTRIAFQKLACWVAFGVACGLTGCGPGPQAEFQYRDSTLKLIPEAQKATKKTLEKSFGTPHELVAWERFPIEYGGARGSVAAPTEGKRSAANSVTAVFEGGANKVKKGSPLLWLTGPRTGEKSAGDSIANYNAKTNELEWSGPAEPVPAPGDRFVVGFGEALQQGRKVYMKNCMHCHGVSGDGAGPTAEYLYPRPRDYRLGLFKFTSTLAAEKISRDDLHRVVKYGIPGTYMPSFLLLGETETKSVVEYVRWLAVRGELELQMGNDLGDYSEDEVAKTVKNAANANEAAKKAGEKSERPVTLSAARKSAVESFKNNYLSEDEKTAKKPIEDSDKFVEEVDGNVDLLAGRWTSADDPANVIVPSVPRVADDAASRERGRLLYMSDKTKCYTCHGMLGKGDGAATEDFWKKPGSEELYSERGLHDAWGRILQPRNLTLGQYRGGRRPVDVFRRVYAGIKGTPMPGFGKTALKDNEIWDVVNYAMSIQYQSQQPEKAKPVGHVAATGATAK